MKYEFLRIQHHLNSIYANRSFDTDRALNRVNADINHLIHLSAKKKLELLDYIEEIKLLRENIMPNEDELMSLYDEYIYELELLAYHK